MIVVVKVSIVLLCYHYARMRCARLHWLHFSKRRIRLAAVHPASPALDNCHTLLVPVAHVSLKKNWSMRATFSALSCRMPVIVLLP